MLEDSKIAAWISVQDLQRARAFYAEKLGLKPSEERPAGLLYRCGEGEFGLFESVGAASGDHTQMGWEVEDIEATVEWLRGRGVVFEEYDFPGLRTVNGIAEVRDSEGNLFGKGAWFRDSEGNILGINRPTDELRRTMLGPDR
jgi:catechol 2,3-dioxygenase-like lactoylglutathione lyase family enzyme